MSRPIRGVLLFLFLCSGATALVYEVLWSKFLSQMLGSTVYAQTVVLATFMGGLALGNRLIGNWSDRLRHPVKIYGLLEIGIGVYGCAFATIYELADRAFVALGTRVLEQGALLFALKALFSVSLLLLPTVMMGGTLPLLAAWLKRNFQDAGRNSALFYAINSIGAVIGAAVGGFYLVQNWGMIGALLLAGAVNLLVGVCALVLDRHQSFQTVSPQSVSASPPPTTSFSPWGGAALLVGVTGGISMGLEILASRTLALIFGSSLQSFAVVLMAFILGIGLGSTVISGLRLQRAHPQTLIVILLVIAAGWVSLLVLNIDGAVRMYLLGKSAMAKSGAGYTLYLLFTVVMSIIVLGVPAALIGSVLPLIIRTLAPTTEALGQTVGRLLTWNTLGAVVGVILAGFVLMPAFGLRAAFLLLAMALGAAALVLAWRKQWRAGFAIAGAAMAVALGIMVIGSEQWRHTMSCGAFRVRDFEGSAENLARRKNHTRLLFYEDAPDATVTVEQGDGIGMPGTISLRINGKTDASSARDLCTQLLSGHLPLLARPDSKDVFILGVGSAITGGAVIAHPVQHLALVDNCAPIFRAARLFDPWNRGVLTNPVARLWNEDARTVLKLSPKQYDVIITEPSNPWTAGIGSVFSLEFYELVAKRLKPGGLILQWFHIYENNDALVMLVLRTVGQVFPFMELWDCGSGDILILASQQAWPTSPDSFREAFNRPQVKKDMDFLGIVSPEALMLRQIASQRTGFAIAGEGPVQTDLFPVLEYAAPKAFFMGDQALLFQTYDERTRQERAAPPAKRKLLASLDRAQIRPLFTNFSTVNPDLMRSVEWAVDSERLMKRVRREHDEMPSILGLKKVASSAPEIPPNADAITTNLIHARWLVDNDHIREGVTVIEKLLLTARPDANWLPASYAAFAAEACLQAGHNVKAGELLLLGLRFAPNDPELLYLARIVEREIKRNTSGKLTAKVKD